MKRIIREYHKVLQGFSVYVRCVFWSMLFDSFGYNSYIYGRIKVYGPENISFGSNSTINEGCLLNARNKIKIGSFVHISPYCALNTGSLNYKEIMGDRGHTSSSIDIEDGVWLGTNVLINPGVKIGENSVIGAGSVVSSNIPKNTVAFGVPAKVVKSIYD